MGYSALNGSGLGIVDNQYCDVAVNTLRPLRTKLTDYLSNDELTQFYPCNQLATTNTLPFSRDGLSAGVQNATTTNYLEEQYLNIASTPATALPVTRYFPLGSFKDTFLAMDKDTVFGGDMYLRLYTQYLQRVGAYTTTPANINGSACVQIATTVNATNVYLWLAIEENLDIRNGLLTALAHGSIKFTIPYLYTYRFSVSGNSPNGNVSLTLTKNYGRGVKSICLVPYNAQEYTNYAFDHSNVNGTKITSLQTTMDGRPLTDQLINCFNPYSSINTSSGQVWANPPTTFADDYREALKFTNNSCLLGYPQYQTNWSYTDAWGVPSLDCHMEACGSAEINDYFDLVQTGDHIYALSSLTPAIQQSLNNCFTSGLINYLLVTFIRTLEIAPDGIVLSP